MNKEKLTLRQRLVLFTLHCALKLMRDGDPSWFLLKADNTGYINTDTKKSHEGRAEKLSNALDVLRKAVEKVVGQTEQESEPPSPSYLN